MDNEGERQNTCKKFHFIIMWTPVWCMLLSTAVYTACRSCVNVNHLHLNIWTFYSYIYILVVYIYIYIFTLTWGQCKYLSNTLPWFCVNVWECVKCLYYMPFMPIPSCKSILIRCGCIPKLNFVFLQLATLIGPSQKNHYTLIFPKHYHFVPIWDYGGVIPKNILKAHFALPHCLTTTFINSTTIILWLLLVAPTRA
jgi:hypothetical protein